MWKLAVAMAKKARVVASAASSAAANSSGIEAGTGTEPIVAMARGLAEIVTEHHLTELVVESGGTTITVRRQLAGAPGAPQAPAMPMHLPVHLPTAATHAPAAAPAATAPVVDDKAHVVTSPFVGTFYRKPNPDSPSYVSLNERVEKGQALCIVEAMKLMNEIEADVAGTIVGILVDDGSSVEYGQPLFKIAT